MNSNGRIIRLTETASTNNYTSELVRQSGIHDWTAVVADYQNAGRGQRGKGWVSNRGENILCSIYRRLTLPSKHQFFISCSVALGVCDYLRSKGVTPQLKWPNDILVNGKKMAGLLIENHVAYQNLEQSVIGIGLNVNQLHFQAFNWPATSLALETGETYDLEKELEALLAALKIAMAANVNAALLSYQELIFGKHQNCVLRLGNGLIEGTIKGIDSNGALVMETEQGINSYTNGSIERIDNASEGSLLVH